MGRTVYGLKNVHIAVWNDETKQYGAWIAIPGAVNLSADTQVNTSDFYADDVIYDSTNSPMSETGTAEFAALEEPVRAALFGDINDSEHGLYITTTDPNTITVALGYEVSGNQGKMRGIRYNVKFTQPSESASTMTENTDPQTITLNYTAIGRDFTIGGEVKNVLKARCYEASTSYATFWDAVLLPGTIPVVNDGD